VAFPLWELDEVFWQKYILHLFSVILLAILVGLLLSSTRKVLSQTNVPATPTPENPGHIEKLQQLVATRRQTPVPRPFYCSRYDDPNIPGEDFFTHRHAWFFFRMPETITISIEYLYGLP
jgi:hypothetical protein